VGKRADRPGIVTYIGYGVITIGSRRLPPHRALLAPTYCRWSKSRVRTQPEQWRPNDLGTRYELALLSGAEDDVKALTCGGLILCHSPRKERSVPHVKDMERCPRHDPTAW